MHHINPCLEEDPMIEFICKTCGPDWSGAYNMDHRCVACGDRILPRDHREVRHDQPRADRFTVRGTGHVVRAADRSPSQD